MAGKDRTRPDADAPGVPGDTVSGAAAGPAPDTPVTTIAEDERGTQEERARPAPAAGAAHRPEPPDTRTGGRPQPRGGTVDNGTITPVGRPSTD